MKHLVKDGYVVIAAGGGGIPVVADEHADPEAGSGAVKITPAHDFNDFEVGKRHNLPQINMPRKIVDILKSCFCPGL